MRKWSNVLRPCRWKTEEIQQPMDRWFLEARKGRSGLFSPLGIP